MRKEDAGANTNKRLVVKREERSEVLSRRAAVVGFSFVVQIGSRVSRVGSSTTTHSKTGAATSRF